MSAEIIRILKVWRCCGLFPRTFESSLEQNQTHEVTGIGPASFTLIGMSIILLIVKTVLCIVSLHKSLIEPNKDLQGVDFLSLQAWNIMWVVCNYLFYSSIISNNKNTVKSIRSLLTISDHLGMHNYVSTLDGQQRLCVLILILSIIQLITYSLRTSLTVMDYITLIVPCFTMITFLLLIASFYKNVAVMYKVIISKSGQLFGETEMSFKSPTKLYKLTSKSEKITAWGGNHFFAANSNPTFNDDHHA